MNSQPTVTQIRRSAILGAENMDRFAASWDAAAESLVAFFSAHGATIAARAAKETRSNPHARKFLMMARDNIAGEGGFVLQAKIETADGAPDQSDSDCLDRTWREWCEAENCDIAGRRSFDAICREAIASWVKTGEFFIKICGGKSASPWGFAIQQIDARRIPWTLNIDNTDGTRIRNGIHLSANDRALGYYVAPRTETPYGIIVQHCRASDCDYVPAEQMIHFYIAEGESDQYRGLTPLYPMLGVERMTESLAESLLLRARAASDTRGLLRDTEPRDSRDLQQQDSDEEVEVSEPASMRYIGDREFIDQTLAFPDASYQTFTQLLTRRTASALGVFYANLSSDYTQSNFSSSRMGLLGEQDMWRTLQREMIQKFCSRLYKAWLKHALAAGKIVLANGYKPGIDKLRKFSEVAYSGHRWGWLDPNTEADAYGKLLNLGLVSRSEIVRSRGGDFWNVLQERAREEADMAALGFATEINLPGATNVKKE